MNNSVIDFPFNVYPMESLLPTASE